MRQLDQINAFLSSGPHPIERRFADQLLQKFLAEMDAAQGGEDLVTTLIKEKRHENRPKVLYQENEDGSFQTAEFSTIDSRSGQIALLQLSGAMMQDDFLSTKGMRSFADDIRKADQHPNIAGIIIEANTGGGELLAGQTLRNAIKDTKKPVLVYAHYLASAGVWGTLFADHIMAAGKGSEVGSIGVFTSVSKGFLSAYKDQVLSVYSKKSPNKNSTFRALLDGDTSVLQASLTEADEIFMADVQRNRPLAGNVEDTLAGGMFFGSEAKARGLVDSIGTFNEAVAEIQRLIRTKNQTKMSKAFSLKALVKTLFGKEVATEEEAEQILSTATPIPQTDALNTAVETLSANVTALQGEVATLRAEAETLRTEVARLASIPAPVIPENLATQEVVTSQVDALRTEVATQLNEIRASRSGADVDGDGALSLPGKKKVKGEEVIDVDLLDGVRKQKSFKVVTGLR